MSVTWCLVQITKQLGVHELPLRVAGCQTNLSPPHGGLYVMPFCFFQKTSTDPKAAQDFFQSFF